MTENKENVYEKDAQAVETEKGEKALGKFKDVNALLEAYGALEAEFTRRSQRLKALEKEAENFKAEREKYLSAEKAEKPTESEKEISSAQNLAEEPAFVSVPPEQVGQTAVGVSNDGEAEIGETKVENPKIGADSPETVSEETRLKIVREYLESLRGGGVPVSKNGGTLGGAAVKVKSVKEAGNMALRFFKNNQNQ